MKFNILTLFPDFFESPLKSGLLGKAIESKILSFNIIDIRSFTKDKFKRCDDYPYGGGCGMVLMPEPVLNAMASIKTCVGAKTIVTSASGELFTQQMAREYSTEKEITIICGHYEGIDQRVIDCADKEISIGDYVLSGGEFASLVIADSVARLIPGFMSNPESVVNESYEDELLEHPQYTRPSELNGIKVPDVLINGNHAKIDEWQKQQRLSKTKRLRPDLYEKYILKQIIGDKIL